MNIAEDIVMCMPIGIAKSAAHNTTHYPRPTAMSIENHMQFAGLWGALQPNTAPMLRRHRWSRRCFDAGLGAPAAAAPPPPPAAAPAAAAAAAHLGWIQAVI